MITKVLIVEDHESANISVQKTLEEMAVKDIQHVYYCDDALQKIMIAKQNNEPYDILITDLYFEDDGSPQQIITGTQLIAAARQVQPELKVLVFSAESKPAIVENLFDRHRIDGYVRKARHDAKDLKDAIQAIDQNQRYFPRQLLQLIKQRNSYQFDDFEITIVSLLAQGVRQKQIPQHLEQMQIRPAGLSSVEKRLNHIKEVLNFTNNEQLIAFCKDMGII